MPSAEEHAQILAEELEVLESIYIDELESESRALTQKFLMSTCASLLSLRNKAKMRRVRLLLTVPPKLVLHVKYTDNYPDEIPQVAITVREDESGVFGEAPETLTEENAPEDIPDSDARPGVQELLHGVLEADREAQAEASRKRDAELEAEAEKFRGTAVTVERFNTWRIEFERERVERREREEAAYVSSLSAKEREEYRRFKTKPSGRQIFSKDVAVDEDKGDDSVKDVDWSQYSREDREKQAREDLGEVEDGIKGVDIEDSDDD